MATWRQPGSFAVCRCICRTGRLSVAQQLFDSCPVPTHRTARLSAANQALVAAEEAVTAERDSRREAEGGRALALAELEAAVAELSGLRLGLNEARQDKVRGGGGGG